MRKKITIWVGACILGLSAVSCDLRRDTEAEEETQSANMRDETRNVNPSSHVDTKDGPGEPPVTSAEVGGNVMTARKNIMGNISSNRDLVNFTSALKQAQFVEMLNGTGPYTVFAPTDEAFKAMQGDRLKDLFKPENRQQLQTFLNNHLVTGKLTTADLQDGAMLKTAGGNQLRVTKSGGNQITVNGAAIEEADAESSNGVVHVVSQVLVSENQ